MGEIHLLGGATKVHGDVACGIANANDDDPPTAEIVRSTWSGTMCLYDTHPLYARLCSTSPLNSFPCILGMNGLPNGPVVTSTRSNLTARGPLASRTCIVHPEPFSDSPICSILAPRRKFLSKLKWEQYVWRY